ncbi:hypothetical protein M3Y99_01145800 [Aphelenchoides fujianensis]|nr:hypothetical protein M3Y99_01145800 [Aphelenchoides fujianensis]
MATRNVKSEAIKKEEEDFCSSSTFIVRDRQLMWRPKIPMAANRRTSVCVPPSPAPPSRSALQRRQSVDQGALPLPSNMATVRTRVLSTDDRSSSQTAKLISENDRLRGENQRLQADIRILRSNQKLLQDRLATTNKTVGDFELRLQQLEGGSPHSTRESPPAEVNVEEVVGRVLELLPKNAEFAALLETMAAKKRSIRVSGRLVRAYRRAPADGEVGLAPARASSAQPHADEEEESVPSSPRCATKARSSCRTTGQEDEENGRLEQERHLPHEVTSAFDLSDFRSPSPLKSSTMKEEEENESDGGEDVLNATYTISSDENTHPPSPARPSSSNLQPKKLDFGPKMAVNRRRPNKRLSSVSELQSYPGL